MHVGIGRTPRRPPTAPRRARCRDRCRAPASTASPLAATNEVAIHGGDAADVAPSPLRASTIRSPTPDAARGDGAGVAAEIARSAQHELHRHAERRVDAARSRDRPLRDARAGSARRTRASRAERWTTLSPVSAATGMVTTCAKSKLPAMVAEVGFDLAVSAPPTSRPASILLTASTTFLMPTRSQIAAWRRVWRLTPWRASTSRMATSACEAPVAMLRVYCSCPGESMMMKRRCGRLEIAPGDVDGDALLALGLEAVEQQAEIDLLAVDRAIMRGVHAPPRADPR